MKLENYLIDNIDLFDNLCKRLQDDYNNVKQFQQTEEDRLILYNLIELVEEKKGCKNE